MRARLKVRTKEELTEKLRTGISYGRMLDFLWYQWPRRFRSSMWRGFGRAFWIGLIGILTFGYALRQRSWKRNGENDMILPGGRVPC
jgi:hypothetical protein